MTKTKKDFIKDFCESNPFNKTLVSMVVDKYEQWIKHNMLLGNCIRMEFGKFSVVTNKYVPKGMQEKSPGFHRHTYRPCFKFLQRFKAEIDRAEGDITRNIQEQEQ